MKAIRSDQGAMWEVVCPVCGEPQTVPDKESTWDCGATPGCTGELSEPAEDAEDYEPGDEVEYA